MGSNHQVQYDNRYDRSQKLSVSTVDTRKESKALLPPTPKSPKIPRTRSAKILSSLGDRASLQNTVEKINDWWLIELGACLVSLSAMLALILVISHYEGKPLQKWPLRITIGTYIAVCSKVMSAMLLVPVVNSMSQYKWYMYQQSTGPLDAMGLVDNATRGTGGSILLLLKHRRVVVQPPDQPAIARIQSYTHPWPISSDLSLGSLGFDNVNTAEKSIKAAVYDGLFGNNRQITASCSTGNCHWPKFMSLAVCNRCQNVAHSIDSQHALPYGLRLTNYTLINASTAIGLTEMGHTPWSLLDLSVLGLEKAYECSIFWCVKEYDTSMVNGSVVERTVNTWSNQSLHYDRWDVVENSTPRCHNETRLGGQVDDHLTVRSGDCAGGIGCCYIDLYASPNYTSNTKFSVDYMTHYTLRSFLGKTLEGNITLASGTSLVYIPKEMQAFSAISKPFQAHSNITSIGQLIKNTTLVDIPKVMDNITDSITIRMRQAVTTDPLNTPVVGVAYEMQTIIQFRYLWLLYPGVLLLSTFALLITMMWMNHRSDAPLWKSNPNSLLFSGLGEERWNRATPPARLSDLDGLAAMTHAKLEKVDERWQLVGTAEHHQD